MYSPQSLPWASWFVFNSEGSWERTGLQLAVCAQWGSRCLCVLYCWLEVMVPVTGHSPLCAWLQPCSPVLADASAAVPALISGMLSHILFGAVQNGLRNVAGRQVV